MKIIEKRRWRWGDMYGPRYSGYKVKLFGVTVWRSRKPIGKHSPSTA